MPTKNTTKFKCGSTTSKKTRLHKSRRRPTDEASVDELLSSEPRTGLIGGLTREQAQRHYAHVNECTIRIATKLEAADTPKVTRRVLEAYLADLGAQYFPNPSVVRKAYNEVCLCVSHPPFPISPIAE